MSFFVKMLNSNSNHFEVRADSDNYLPKIQSHRGFRNTEITLRENTLEAIQKSYELGYLMVEFDVRLTSDHQVVLYHDEKIDGNLVSKLSLSELQSRLHVDLLIDVFKWHQEMSITNYKFNIEIKSRSTKGVLEKKVYSLIQQFKLEKNILISSFNPISLMYFRLLDNTIFRSLLLTFANQDGNNFVIKSMMMNVLARPNALHLNEVDWKYQDFKKLIDKNVPIVLWTCNDFNLVNVYLTEGIAGVISDIITPDQLCIKEL